MKTLRVATILLSLVTIALWLLASGCVSTRTLAKQHAVAVEKVKASNESIRQSVTTAKASTDTVSRSLEAAVASIAAEKPPLATIPLINEAQAANKAVVVELVKIEKATGKSDDGVKAADKAAVGLIEKAEDRLSKWWYIGGVAAIVVGLALSIRFQTKLFAEIGIGIGGTFLASLWLYEHLWLVALIGVGSVVVYLALRYRKKWRAVVQNAFNRGVRV